MCHLLTWRSRARRVAAPAGQGERWVASSAVLRDLMCKCYILRNPRDLRPKLESQVADLPKWGDGKVPERCGGILICGNLPSWDLRLAWAGARGPAAEGLLRVLQNLRFVVWATSQGAGECV